MAVIVVEVVTGTTTPTTTKTVAESLVSVVQPGGSVANVQWGDTLPENPVEGQIFIKVTA